LGAFFLLPVLSEASVLLPGTAKMLCSVLTQVLHFLFLFPVIYMTLVEKFSIWPLLHEYYTVIIWLMKGKYF